MGRRMVVCGKGGVGKTSVVAMISRFLLDEGKIRALVIDGDPSAGLAMALGLDPDITLDDIRKGIIERVKRHRIDREDLGASADYSLFDALEERDNLAFLSIGRPEEEGCYCQVNNMLRKAIGLLSDEFELTLIDAEAGIEQINRRIVRDLDDLLLLSDPTAKGLRVSETIKRVADESIEYGRVHLYINHPAGEAEMDKLRGITSLEISGWIPEDYKIREYDLAGTSFFELPPCPALEAVYDICRDLGLSP